MIHLVRGRVRQAALTLTLTLRLWELISGHLPDVERAASILVEESKGLGWG